jgi:hypothetical protein
VLRVGWPAQIPDLPLVVYCNHPAWWDPLLCLVLAQRFFPERTHYAPIDSRALARYRFLAHLGFFGITPGTRHGAATFLHLSQALLQQPWTALWLTPAGQLTDPRQRPVHFQPGLGHLARRLNRAVFLPLALEYPFWEERFPEVLACFGQAIMVQQKQPWRAQEWTVLLAHHLEAAQEQLAGAACRRERQDFAVLLRGRAGIGGVYDLWRRLRARLGGQTFRQAHGEED